MTGEWWRLGSGGLVEKSVNILYKNSALFSMPVDGSLCLAAFAAEQTSAQVVCVKGRATGRGA